LGEDSIYTKQIAPNKYQVVDGKLDGKKEVYDEKGNIIAKTITQYSGFNEEGQIVKGAVVNLNDSSGKEFLNEKVLGQNLSSIEYGINAFPNQMYDFKSQVALNGLTPDQRNNRAMPIDGTILVSQNFSIPTIATARDIGNISAGYVTGVNGVSWGTDRFIFNIVNFVTKPNFQFNEAPVSTSAQQIGWSIGNNQIVKYSTETDNKSVTTSKVIK
jgi:hypothetical protein